MLHKRNASDIITDTVSVDSDTSNDKIIRSKLRKTYRYDDCGNMNYDVECMASFDFDTYAEDLLPYNVGETIECYEYINNYGKWHVCTVIDATPNEILVHYQGWSNEFDEWLNLSDDNDLNRIAQTGTHTNHEPHQCEHYICKEKERNVVGELIKYYDLIDILNGITEIGSDVEAVRKWLDHVYMYSQNK